MPETSMPSRPSLGLQLAQLVRTLPDFPGRDTLLTTLVARTLRCDAMLRGRYGGGLCFEGNPARDGNVIDMLLLRFGRPCLAPVLDAALEPGGAFADVGANNGLYTLWGARRVGKTGRVYAFEPLPDVRARLARNIELNGFDNVVIVPGAVGANPSTISLRRAADASGRTSRFLHEGTIVHSVPVVTLDDQFRGSRPPDLVKIDVEGMEIEVLRGARELLGSERAPAVVFEAGASQLAMSGTPYAELLQLLADAGAYRVFALTPAGLRVEPQDAVQPGSLNVLALRPALPAHERIRSALAHVRFEANQNA